MCEQGLSKHAVRLSCLKSVTFSRDWEGKDITPVQLLAACYSLGKHGFGQDLKIFYCIFLWLNAPDIGNSVIQWENISILGKAVLSIPGVPSNSVTIKKDDDNSTPRENAAAFSISDIFMAWPRKHGNCMMFRVDDDDSAPGTQQRWQDCNYTGESDETAGQRFFDWDKLCCRGS